MFSPNIASSSPEIGQRRPVARRRLWAAGRGTRYLANSRKVNSAQVELDADKNLIRVSKTLLDSPELHAIRRVDGDLRRYLYNMCLPFEPGIPLLPIGLIGTVDARLHEFEAKREELVETFLAAYPRLCEEASGRLRTLYNPLD